MSKYDVELINQIKKLYLDDNLSQPEIAQKLNLKESTIKYLVKQNNFKKSKELEIVCKKRILMEKYGTDVPLKNTNSLNKMKETNLQRYGCENPMQNKDIQQKVVQTNLKKYGVKYGLQDKQIREKIEITNLKKYGSRTVLSTDVIKTKIRKTNLKKYGVDNPMKNKIVQQKMAKTNIEKYGSSTPFGNKQIQDKIKLTNLKKYGSIYTLNNKSIRDKIQKTNLEKYGSSTPFGGKEIQEKIKKVNLKKFGCEKVLHCRKIREKISKTNIEKYGSISPFGNKQIQDKIKEINLKKFGYENPLQSKVIRHKVLQTNIERNCPNYDLFRSKEKLEEFLISIPEENRIVSYCSSLLNCSPSTLCGWIQYHGIREDILINNNRSHYEIEIAQWIKTFYEGNIIINYKEYKKYEVDIFIPEFNLGIEFNGTYWHSSDILPNDYHYKKSKFFEEKGIRLIHIFEYEWNNERQKPILENIIKSALGVNKTLYARKLDIVVKESKNMKDFFNTNNIQGFRGGKFAICLVDKSTREVYMSYMIGNAFFGKGKYQYEVIRGATKLGYNVVGGASKIWKYFIENYNPDSCVYYIDYNYFNGNSLKNLPNMEFIKMQPSFKNWWVKEGIIKNREPLRHKEVKELYKTGEVKQIWNAGTKVYVWERGNV